MAYTYFYNPLQLEELQSRTSNAAKTCFHLFSPTVCSLVSHCCTIPVSPGISPVTVGPSVESLRRALAQCGVWDKHCSNVSSALPICWFWPTRRSHRTNLAGLQQKMFVRQPDHFTGLLQRVRSAAVKCGNGNRIQSFGEGDAKAQRRGLSHSIYIFDISPGKQNISPQT